MAELNAAARAVIREAGLTVAEFARMCGYQDGKWHGDACGCTDTGRCMNGFHHFPDDECGCLRTLLDDAVAWREASREPNRVALSAPFGLFRWVNVSTPGSLVTVSATAGGFRAADPAESVVRIEARDGWTATAGEDEHGRMEVRIAKAAAPEAAGMAGDSGPAGLLTESQRFQVQEARDALGTWDLARAPGEISRESVLADQVRALLDIIGAVAPAAVEGNDSPGGEP